MNENAFKSHFFNELEYLRKQHSNLIIDDYIDVICEITDIFSSQGHSGGSAPGYYNTLSKVIKNVLSFQPLSPITGEYWEWCNTSGSSMFQNSRLSSVFKDGEDGRAYYLDAIVWKGEDDWDTFTGTVEGVRSRQFVKFPFTPKTFYIDVYREPYDKNNPKHKNLGYTSCGSGDYVYLIKDRNQLVEVFEYYDEFKDNLKA